MTAATVLRQGWAAPAAVGAVALVGTAVVAAVDPNQAGNYPTCPFLATTGLWCPGCGTLRAIHALTQGDLALAANMNVLLLVALPLIAFGWLQWMRHGLGRRARPPDLPTWAGPTIVAVVGIFWVVRNLPFGSALAPLTG